MTPLFRLGRWQVSAEGALVLAVAAFLLSGLSNCHGRRDGAADANLAQLQANAVKVARAYKASRDSIPVLQARTDEADAGRVRAEAGQRRAEARLRAVLDDADGVVRDTGVSRDTLRAHLSRVTLQARALLAQHAVYRDSVRGLVDAFAAERAGYNTAVLRADSTIAAKEAVISALTTKARCRILGALPCPSRTASFGAGVIVTLTLVLL